MQEIKSTESAIKSNRKVKDTSLYNKPYIYINIAVVFIIIIGSAQLGSRNYLLFHSISEIFSVFIAFGVFVIAINTHDTSKNTPFLLFGIAMGFTGMFDLMHIFSTSSLGIFSINTTNLSMQFWIAARFIYSLSILLSSILFYKSNKKVSSNFIVWIYLIICTLIFLTITFWKTFPECQNPEIGITMFKIISEYIVAVVIFFTMVVFYYARRYMAFKVFILMQISFLCIMISEILLTSIYYHDNTLNIIVHMLKIISCYAAYKAIVETSLRNPYDQLYCKLDQTSSNLVEKDSQLQAANMELKAANIHRQTIEEALMKNVQCYKLLIDNSNDAIFIHCDGKILFANKEAATLTEARNMDDLIGMQIIDLVASHKVEEVKQKISERYKHKGITPGYESKIKSFKGKVIDVEIAGAYFVYEDKPAMLSILRDISTYKQIEKLKAAAERDRELLNETLESNKLITEFFSNVSHELKTPLNVILGAIQVLTINIGKNKYISIMRQNCYRLLRLINNLIDISKIDSGFYKLNLQNNNIVSVVEEIVLSVAEYVENKGIKLVFDTEVEEKIICFDPDKIERIMLNLLSNSIKFTDEGGEISVFIKDGEQSISIYVKDTGIGIPEDKLKVIFERFTQVERALTRNNQGSGIGLSLVKSLVEMHEGRVSISSKVGQGTEFVIELPVKALDVDKEERTDKVYSNKIERIDIEFSDIYSYKD